MNTRNAVVEGRFYPASKQEIFRQIREIENAERYPVPDLKPEVIFGAVLPHAGHVYSGYQTVPFFQLVQRAGHCPETFVIVHPNHSGYGGSVAIDNSDSWTNSIGPVPVDRDFAKAMNLPYDGQAHAREHSAEVIIPYMQYYLPEHSFSIVPVCMKDQSHSRAVTVAQRILQAKEETGKSIMLLASSDFSHYLSPGDGKARDQHVVDEIHSRNSEGVERAVQQVHASVCGYGPIMALMNYSGSLDRYYKVKILARGHSGEVIPSREVVDYISMIMYR
jgi:AmmeMemoRadiSam system protein B